MANDKIKVNVMEKLHNREISESYSDISFHLMLSDFKGAFAYWVASQNHNDILENNNALKAYANFIELKFKMIDKVPFKFDCTKLKSVVNEDLFMAIPEIMKLNKMEPEFIDLGALARNVYYMILRKVITQSEYEKN